MTSNEKKKARQHRYYEAHKEKINARNRAYYEANKEKASQWKRNYRHSNRGLFKSFNQARRDRLALRSDPSITPDVINTLFQKAKLCPYCGKKLSDTCSAMGDSKTLDHLTPLVKGGWHCLSNVVVCCFSCNAKKHDFSYSEWLNRLDEPHRTRAEKLYIRLNKASPYQCLIPFVD